MAVYRLSVGGVPRRAAALSVPGKAAYPSGWGQPTDGAAAPADRMGAMATNKYEDFCPACRHRLAPGRGILKRGRTGWLTYCPEHVPDPSESRPELEARPHEGRRHERLAAFLHARLDEDDEGTSGDGTGWRHHPARSGIVIDDHDVQVLQTWRHVADHLETWHPNRARANVNSRRLIVDLFEAAAAGSDRKTALREAVQALAMTHHDHPDYDPAWTLLEF